MLHTTAGQLAVNALLPEDLRDQTRVLDKKAISTLLQKVIEKYPDRYREIARDLLKVGYHTAHMTGGHSFGLSHMRLSLAGRQSQMRLEEQSQRIYGDPKLSDQDKESQVVQLLLDEAKPLEEKIYQESLSEHNPLALQVLSGARGNKTNLRSLRGSDLLYVDHHDHPIPVPILKSYAQGFSPVEYFAGTFGARKGVADTKFATQDAGFFCLAEDTLVRLPDGGNCPINRLSVGDIVLGADKEGHTFPVCVTGVSHNGMRDVWSYRFRMGKTRGGFIEVKATAEHRVLAKMKRGREGTRHGDKNSILVPTLLPLARASTGFRLVPSGVFLDSGANGRSWDGHPWAGILGLLLSEGGLTGHTVNFSSADPQFLAAIQAALEPQGFFFEPITNHPYEYIIKDQHPFCKTFFGPVPVGTFFHRLRAWLHSLGVLGKLAHEKTMPAEVYSWSNAAVARLLAYLFEGDGYVVQTNHGKIPCIGLGMAAKPLVEAIRDLLALRFGIHTPPVRTTQQDNNRPCHTMVIATRQGVERFLQHIAMPGVKGNLLQQLWLAAPAATRDDGEMLFSFHSKAYLGKLPTCDIEVDHPDHLFVLANGAIVSNSKQLNQVSHRLTVTKHDREQEPEHPVGLPVETSDPDNEGALLAHDIGGYKRNTVLTPKIIADLHSRGHAKVLVRSPMTGGPPDGGLYARDVGIREKGGLAPIGDYVGIAAAQALSEPLSQAQLSSKHSGGVAGAAKGVSGFKLVNQLVQVPKTFKGGAAHAEVDGKVQNIERAPQGGNYVTVNGTRHYVGTGYNLLVKPGDHVEAGDVLSEGIPNPAKVVKYKGIGEGRRYFMESFRKAYADSGITSHRRNVEVVARGLIDHVRLQDEMGDWVPGDVVPYSRLEHHYQPRDGHVIVDPRRAQGMYLEKPVLHYSIGTQVRPSVIKQLEHFGVKNVVAHHDPAPFEPEMIRGMENLAHDPDWMTRFLGSYLEKNLLRGVHRGATSDTAGTSFVPALAEGSGFGRQGKTVGWKPKSILKPPDPEGMKLPAPAPPDVGGMS